MNRAENLAAVVVKSNKTHRARVIDLGQTGDEDMTKLSDRRKEAKSQIFGRDVAEETLKQRFILGAYRTQINGGAITQGQNALHPFG